MRQTPQHDTGYKLLFSHPEMVRDLLTGYLPPADGLPARGLAGASRLQHPAAG